ncbi:hypothetical protein DFH27DRAFT_609234 [Peziza echinospora]|nr:hypothetical protein DFH27DRAFT_609234 [Peziza echinospora]
MSPTPAAVRTINKSFPCAAADQAADPETRDREPACGRETGVRGRGTCTNCPSGRIHGRWRLCPNAAGAVEFLRGQKRHVPTYSSIASASRPPAPAIDHWTPPAPAVLLAIISTAISVLAVNHDPQHGARSQADAAGPGCRVDSSLPGLLLGRLRPPRGLPFRSMPRDKRVAQSLATRPIDSIICPPRPPPSSCAPDAGRRLLTSDTPQKPIFCLCGDENWF